MGNNDLKNDVENIEKLTPSQRSYVDGIAKDFGFLSIDKLSIKLGFINSQDMARNHNFDSIYEFFTKPGHVGRYLNIEHQLKNKITKQKNKK